MKRIIVIGCPGSGKTTLSKVLAQKLNLPLIHLDRIQWKGNWECIRSDEFDNILRAEINKPQWIIDGNYNRTIPMRLEQCDTVIYLDYPACVCFFSALKRVITNFGRVRDDMGGNCRERFDPTFFWFILTFNIKNRKKYHTIFNNCVNKNIIILKNRKQADKFLNNI